MKVTIITTGRLNRAHCNVTRSQLFLNNFNIYKVSIAFEAYTCFLYVIIL